MDISPLIPFGKIGRNEKCPCGSDLKFKHCHGTTEAITQFALKKKALQKKEVIDGMNRNVERWLIETIEKDYGMSISHYDKATVSGIISRNGYGFNRRWISDFVEQCILFKDNKEIARANFEYKFTNDEKKMIVTN